MIQRDFSNQMLMETRKMFPQEKIIFDDLVLKFIEKYYDNQVPESELHIEFRSDIVPIPLNSNSLPKEKLKEQLHTLFEEELIAQNSGIKLQFVTMIRIDNYTARAYYLSTIDKIVAKGELIETPCIMTTFENLRLTRVLYSPKPICFNNPS